MHFRNLKIKLSRVVWSVSLPRPNSRGHAETARVNNYFVFQDFKFPYVSLFSKFIDKSLGFDPILSNRPGGAMKNDIYRSAWVRTSSKLRKLAAVKIWESTDHYPWSHLQINNQLRIARNKISYRGWARNREHSWTLMIGMVGCSVRDPVSKGWRQQHGRY